MNKAWRAIVAAVVATVLAVASYVSLAALAGVVFSLVVMVAIGWPSLLSLPSRRSSATILALMGLGCVVSVALVPVNPLLEWLPLALAGAIVMVFVHQLFRREGRPHLVESVTGMVTGMLVLASAAGWVAAIRTSGGVSLVVVSAIGIAAACAAVALPIRGFFGVVLTLMASSVAGGGIGMLMPEVSGRAGMLIGLMAGILISTLHVLFARLPNAGKKPAVLASVTLPVAASGIAVYIIGRVLVG